MTAIEWTDKTWNVFAGCSKKSEGCQNCYAINQAHRNAAMGAKLESPGRLAHYQGLTEKRAGRIEWTGKVNFVPEALEIPLKRKKPTKWFVNSMSDLFHEAVTADKLDRVFAVMALCPQHTFQILTKRPERMLEYLSDPFRYQAIHEAIKQRMGYDHPERPAFNSEDLPLKNVHLGVTCENQKAADDRIPLLLQTPAAVRFLSCEPLLGEISLASAFVNVRYQFNATTEERRVVSLYEGSVVDTQALVNFGSTSPAHAKPISWIIIGGESGPNARPCDIQWIRSLVQQCQSAGVAAFVKQLGSNPVMNVYDWYQWAEEEGFDLNESTLIGWDYRNGQPPLDTLCKVPLKGKGNDMDEWPEDLRVREWPNTEVVA